MYPFISDTVIQKAESIADYVFNKTIELSIIVAERRRMLACWRKIKFAEVIRLTNEERLAMGKRPRRMPVWRRKLRIASAECTANCKADPRFLAAHKAADQSVRDMKFLTELTELVAKAGPMTEEQKAKQRISFVYGNLKIDRPGITLEMVEEASARASRSTV